MDQYLSAVIIAAITGVFSIITLIIQKKQESVINKIDEQTVFIEKEKVLKQKISNKEIEKEEMMNQIMILILDTNLHILRNTRIAGATIPNDEVFELSEDLKNKFNRLTEEMQELDKEYNMLLDLTKDFQQSNVPKK